MALCRQVRFIWNDLNQIDPVIWKLCWSRDTVWDSSLVLAKGCRESWRREGEPRFTLGVSSRYSQCKQEGDSWESAIKRLRLCLSHQVNGTEAQGQIQQDGFSFRFQFFVINYVIWGRTFPVPQYIHFKKKCLFPTYLKRHTLKTNEILSKRCQNFYKFFFWLLEWHSLKRTWKL